MITIPLTTLVLAMLSGWIPFYVLARLAALFIRRFVKPRN